MVVMKIKKETKLYSVGQIALATFVGGALAGCYFLSKNFETFGNKKFAARSLWIGVIIVLLIGLLIFVPSSILKYIPNIVIPAVYIGAIVTVTRQYQGKEIVKHFKSKGMKQSWLKVIGISILSAIIILAYLFVFGILVYMLAPNLVPP